MLEICWRWSQVARKVYTCIVGEKCGCAVEMILEWLQMEEPSPTNREELLELLETLTELKCLFHRHLLVDCFSQILIEMSSPRDP